MQSENLIKCAHPPCRCLVELEDQFCSTACASSKPPPTAPCPCGHPDCAAPEQTSKGMTMEFEMKGRDPHPRP
jgi:hypothetical protein